MKQNEDSNDEMENVSTFGYQVKGLTKCCEIIDLDKKLVPEVKGQPFVDRSRTPLADKNSAKL